MTGHELYIEHTRGFTGYCPAGRRVCEKSKVVDGRKHCFTEKEMSIKTSICIEDFITCPWPGRYEPYKGTVPIDEILKATCEAKDQELTMDCKIIDRLKKIEDMLMWLMPVDYHFKNTVASFKKDCESKAGSFLNLEPMESVCPDCSGLGKLQRMQGKIVFDCEGCGGTGKIKKTGPDTVVNQKT